MNHRNLLVVVVLAGLLLGGCHEYRVTVDVNANGSGRRTVALDARGTLGPTDTEVLRLDEPGWSVSEATGDDGLTVHRYRKEVAVATLDGWQDLSGVMILARPGGPSQLLTDIQLERVQSAGGERLVYRETLRWEGIRGELAALSGQSYAAFLREEFPDLPEVVVAELRGVMAATMVMSWDEMIRAEGDPALEDEMTGRIFDLIADRLGAPASTMSGSRPSSRPPGSGTA